MFPCAGQPHDYYLIYFGVHQPARMALDAPEGEQYAVEIIDTWSMITTRLGALVARGASVELSSRPYQALILRRRG